MKPQIRLALVALLAFSLFPGCSTSKSTPEFADRPSSSTQYAEVTQLGSRIPRRVRKSELNRSSQDGTADVSQMAQQQMNQALPAVDR